MYNDQELKKNIADDKRKDELKKETRRRRNRSEKAAGKMKAMAKMEEGCRRKKNRWKKT
jgi:hypothetical protein